MDKINIPPKTPQAPDSQRIGNKHTIQQNKVQTSLSGHLQDTIEVPETKLSERIAANQEIKEQDLEILAPLPEALITNVLEQNIPNINQNLYAIENLSKNKHPIIRIATLILIACCSRIKRVWDRCHETFLKILDRLSNDKDKLVSQTATLLIKQGVRPGKDLQDETTKKTFLTYVQLIDFTSHGSLKLKPNSKNKETLAQEGYSLVEEQDLPQEIIIVRKYEKGNKKPLAPGAFTFDPKTGLIKTAAGLKMALFKDPDNNMILCFAGTKSKIGKGGKRFTKTWMTNFRQNIMGEVPSAYQQARNLVKILNDHYKEKGQTLTLAGYSQGGGLAQYSGIANDVPAYCINSAGLEIGVLKELDQSQKLDHNTPPAVEHIYLEGELVHEILENGLWGQGFGGILLGNIYKIEIPEALKTTSGVERHLLKTVHTALTSS